MTDDELADIRKRVGSVESWYSEDAWKADRPERDVRALLAEVDRLRADLAACEGAVHDLQQEAGAMLAYEQGMAEERARIVGFLDDLKSRASEPHRTTYDLVIRLVRDRVALPDLLPPAVARLALDDERRKVAALRAACERIATSDGDGNAGIGLHRAGNIARKALEDTK